MREGICIEREREREKREIERERERERVFSLVSLRGVVDLWVSWLAGPRLGASWPDVGPIDVPIYGHITDWHLYTSPSPRDRQKSRMPTSAGNKKPLQQRL